MSAVRDIVKDVLGLGARGEAFDENTALLGALPELDSLAVLEVIEGLGARFGIDPDEVEMSGDDFETLGTLTEFVRSHRS